jgi:hypothetical protein
MIEEEDERQQPSRWFPAFLGGIAIGILLTFFVMIFVQERNYVRKDEAIGHLSNSGYVVLTAQEAAALRARPESCATSEVCSNQVDVNRRLKMRSQALEANNLRLIRERDEERNQATQIRERIALQWDFTAQEGNPNLYQCRAGEQEVGAVHDCEADHNCGDPELIRALCAYRYLAQLPDL